MVELEALSEQLRKGIHLSPQDAEAAAGQLASLSVADSDKAGFLRQLNQKGETPAEVAAFARVFRKLAIDPGVEKWAASAIDVCGTGGDHSGSFNISTAVSFVVAAAGVPVFKHGNRSITSRCGSAQLLDALGFPLEAPPEVWAEALDSIHFAFFFAPAFHPAFKAIMPVRQALAKEGQRSIFNILGPLINPGHPAQQLMGVFSEQWVKPIAEALGQIGVKRRMVVHCRLENGGTLDELSCCGQNFAYAAGELPREGAVVVDLKGLGLEPCTAADIAGGDVLENVETLHALLRGNAPLGLTHSVALNAGAALWVAGAAPDLKAGVTQALQMITGGEVAAWLVKTQAFFQA